MRRVNRSPSVRRSSRPRRPPRRRCRCSTTAATSSRGGRSQRTGIRSKERSRSRSATGRCPTRRWRTSTTRPEARWSVALTVARWVQYAGLALALGLWGFVVLCWWAGRDDRRVAFLVVLGASALAVGSAGPDSRSGRLRGLQHQRRVANRRRPLMDDGMRPRIADRPPGDIVGSAPAALGARRRPGRARHPRRPRHRDRRPWRNGARPGAREHPHDRARVGGRALARWVSSACCCASGDPTNPTNPTNRTNPTVPTLNAAVRRFSTLVLGSVVLLAGTGTIQAIRRLETLDALTGSSYGRLLIVKVAVIAVLLAVAALSRFVLRSGELVMQSAGTRRAALAVAAGAGADRRDRAPASPSQCSASRVRSPARRRS